MPPVDGKTERKKKSIRRIRKMQRGPHEKEKKVKSM